MLHRSPRWRSEQCSHGGDHQLDLSAVYGRPLGVENSRLKSNLGKTQKKSTSIAEERNVLRAAIALVASHLIGAAGRRPRTAATITVEQALRER